MKGPDFLPRQGKERNLLRDTQGQVPFDTWEVGLSLQKRSLQQGELLAEVLHLMASGSPRGWWWRAAAGPLGPCLNRFLPSQGKLVYLHPAGTSPGLIYDHHLPFPRHGAQGGAWVQLLNILLDGSGELKPQHSFMAPSSITNQVSKRIKQGTQGCREPIMSEILEPSPTPQNSQPVAEFLMPGWFSG